MYCFPLKEDLVNPTTATSQNIFILVQKYVFTKPGSSILLLYCVHIPNIHIISGKSIQQLPPVHQVYIQLRINQYEFFPNDLISDIYFIKSADIPFDPIIRISIQHWHNKHVAVIGVSPHQAPSAALL